VFKVPVRNVAVLKMRKLAIEENVPKHLQCLLDALPPELTGSDRQQARDFISAIADVFSASEFDLGRNGVVKDTIDTAENRPFKQQQEVTL